MPLPNGGNQLVSFNIATPGTVTTIGNFTGATTYLNDIDFRVSNGFLYGYDQPGNRIVTINKATAATTFVSTPATGISINNAAIDFNPTNNLLRIVSPNDQNLRVTIASGATTNDAALVYAAGDPNAGQNPNIVDIAYTNNDNNAATPTTLYYIDSALNTLVVAQGSPNGGVLNTVGSLGVSRNGQFGFDIYTDTGGVNSAYALFGNGSNPALYSLNLTNGTPTFVGNIGTTGIIFGIAIDPRLPPPLLLPFPNLAALRFWLVLPSLAQALFASVAPANRAFSSIGTVGRR